MHEEQDSCRTAPALPSVEVNGLNLKTAIGLYASRAAPLAPIPIAVFGLKWHGMPAYKR